MGTVKEKEKHVTIVEPAKASTNVPTKDEMFSILEKMQSQIKKAKTHQIESEEKDKELKLKRAQMRRLSAEISDLEKEKQKNDLAHNKAVKYAQELNKQFSQYLLPG